MENFKNLDFQNVAGSKEEQIDKDRKEFEDEKQKEADKLNKTGIIDKAKRIITGETKTPVSAMELIQDEAINVNKTIDQIRAADKKIFEENEIDESYLFARKAAREIVYYCMNDPEAVRRFGTSDKGRYVDPQYLGAMLNHEQLKEYIKEKYSDLDIEKIMINIDVSRNGSGGEKYDFFPALLDANKVIDKIEKR